VIIDVPKSVVIAPCELIEGSLPVTDVKCLKG
jgi:hypothetical protein